MKVLVVEDEFYARKAMIRQIKKYDQDGLFEISEASNGCLLYTSDAADEL